MQVTCKINRGRQSTHELVAQFVVAMIATAELRDALCFARNWVRIMSHACHAEREYPQDGDHGKKADGLCSNICHNEKPLQ